MDTVKKLKEIRRSGKRVARFADPFNDHFTTELWTIDDRAYRITLYCGTMFTLEPCDDIGKYLPKFGGF